MEKTKNNIQQSLINVIGMNNKNTIIFIQIFIHQQIKIIAKLKISRIN